MKIYGYDYPDNLSPEEVAAIEAALRDRLQFEALNAVNPVQYQPDVVGEAAQKKLAQVKER